MNTVTLHKELEENFKSSNTFNKLEDYLTYFLNYNKSDASKIAEEHKKYV